VKKLVAGGALCALAIAVACSGPSYDRRAMLQRIVDKVYLPTLEDLVTRADAVPPAVAAYCDSPSETTLAGARDAWQALHAVWERQEAFFFGPVSDAPLRVGPRLYFWPARPDDIEAVVAETAPIDQAYLDGVGATKKGIAVAEYLLWPGDPAPRRCEYLRALGPDIALRAQELRDAWRDGYAKQVTEAGLGSTAFPTLQDAASESFNRLVFLLQNMRELKLGKPAGKATAGVPQPSLVESPYSGRAMQDLLDNLDGVEAVYREGFTSFVKAIKPELDAPIRQRIADARSALQAIDQPLAQAVVDDAARVEAAFQALKTLEILLSVDTANALGLTVTFNDTDGD
jgi:uncharacterized protein